MLTVTVTSFPGQPFKHELSARGHTIVSDAPTAFKGGDLGMTPHELFLLSLGACQAMTIENYAMLKKWELKKVTVKISEDKVTDPDDKTKTITRIKEEIEIESVLTQEQIDRLKTKARECPVYQLIMGKKVVETTITGGTAPADTSTNGSAAASTGDGTKTASASNPTDTPSPAADAKDTPATVQADTAPGATKQDATASDSCAEPEGGCCNT